MQKFTAIILSSRDIGEFDRMYFLYTRENGVLTAIGKGVRKQTAKLAGHLEPVTLSEVYVARSKGIGQITSAITLENFENLKNDFEKLREILKICQFFVKNFAEEEKGGKIFDLLCEFLRYFGNPENKEYQRTILNESFWWKLFDFLGNRPETMKCLKCDTRFREAGRKFFSAAAGGIICEKCFKNETGLVEMTNNQIKLLRIFLANSFEKILKVKAKEAELRELGRIREEFKKYNF
ncbi:MAG: DNA repair protein RecO [Candidatus Moranbacteria bacterium RBG_13_45_13]|nr:MAG: DNA repair protein RecO [Candidatus Moranbacteria bacterium RBG_13_45_13]